MTTSLTPGRKLAHYEVVELIGKGGMGEVYRARDTKLDRDVAIKVLPDEFAHDAERVARFSREARVLASLNHPNIAAIHGLEQTEGLHYLVLELVPGETLADRIARGPIPVEEALDVSIEIAAALEAAHAQGVVHRDLKPGNVKLTPDDRVKVLDYGLAKALDGDASGGDSSASMSPTITRNATRAGVILGTAAYMSPEQAKGKSADRSADLWAFGAVLYEMLTGSRAFVGEDISETLAAVLRDEPDWEALPDETPLPVRWLIRRCLEKKRRERIADASNIRFAIEQARQTSDAPLSPHTAEERDAGNRAGRRAVALSALAGAAAAVTLTLGLSSFWSEPEPDRPVFVQPLYVPPELAVGWVSISPDGRRIVFTGTHDGVRRIYTRSLSSLQARPLEGTEGARTPIFSPDSEWILFWANDAYRKLRLDGGTAVELFESRTSAYGPAWGASNQVAYGEFLNGLRIAPAEGGAPSVLTIPDREQAERLHRDPAFLPGGESVLFSVNYDLSSDRIAVVAPVASSPTGEGAPDHRVLLEGIEPKFVAKSGHLLFKRGTTLWAAALDSASLRVVSEPVPVLENVGRYDVSEGGTLVYVPSSGGAERTLVWTDRRGVETPVGAPARPYYDPVVSPDGTRVAVSVGTDIWLWDAERSVLSRLTSHPSADFGIAWSPDGNRLAFQSMRDGRAGVFVVSPNAAAEETPLWQGELQTFPADWTGAPERLITSTLREGRMEVMQLPVEPDPGSDAGEIELELVVPTQSYANRARVSPDQRWIAYQSRESGPFNVFVRPYRDPSRDRWQVSTDEGQEPKWSHDGRELYYRTATSMMAVTVSAGEEDDSFSPGVPSPLFALADYDISSFPQTYGLAPDGRFLFLKPVEASDRGALPPLVLIENFGDELERRVATGSR